MELDHRLVQDHALVMYLQPLQNIVVNNMKIPQINISAEKNSILPELMQSVSSFYPIGLQTANDSFPGYVSLIEKTTLKINQLITGELPDFCNKLIQETEEEFSQFKVLTEMDKQFPNYAVTVELLNKDYNEVTIVYNLRLRISLLTNFFTIFHEESIIHKDSSTHHQYFIPIVTNIISSQSIITDEGGTHFNALKNIARAIFPDYKFAGHQLLFCTKITNGVPYRIDQDLSGIEYSLYDFLFDNEYSNPTLTYINR